MAAWEGCHKGKGMKRKVLTMMLSVFLSVSVISSVSAEMDLLTSGDEWTEEQTYETGETENTGNTENTGDFSASTELTETGEDDSFYSNEENPDEEDNEAFLIPETDSEDVLLLPEEDAEDPDSNVPSAQSDEDIIIDEETEMVGATSGQCGANAYWNLSSNGTLTISGRGDMYSFGYVGEDELGNYGTLISNVPWDANAVRSIQIAQGITSIGDYAFYDCKKITKVTIPNGVKSIGSGAFSGCSSLVDITIPNTVVTIHGYAFGGCAMSKITIPNSVTSIGEYAFAQCGSLKSIIIPSSVKKIWYQAFFRCKSLTEITIPNSVREIGWGAFGDCTRLTKVTLSGNMSCIEYSMFSGCTSLKEIVIPGSVNKIQGWAFYGCKNLQKVVIPKSVRTFGDGIFQSCANVKIYGYSGSAAQTYAENEGIPFVEAIEIAGLSNTTSGVKLTWNKVSTAAKYRVYYRVQGESKWIKAADTSSTNYTVTGLASGTTYNFTVRCLNSAGEFNSDAAPTKTLKYIAAPKVRSVELRKTGVAVKWDAVSGAEKYRLFYKVSGASDWTKAADTTGTGYTVNGLTSGKTYVFTVRCVNAAGTGFTSAYDSKGTRIQYITAPIVSSASLTTTGVKVTWNAVGGAEKYRIFYKLSDSSKWTTSGDTTANNYTVKGLTSGKRYVFVVRCVNAAGTAFTSAMDTTGKTLRFVKAPVISSAAAGSKSVTVKWGAVSGAQNYRVFYKLSGASSWTTAGDTTSTSYTVKKLTSGKTYVFTVRCLNKAGTSYTSAYNTKGVSASVK
ncbi:MAG: leucine-rich repeat protein [Eubacteriales bacterium]|nr:leucine-rich repeat protein [Eubacteriales bacterium]